MPDLNEVDLCVVLSNLLDNAIEAEKKEQKKEIRLSISIVGNYLHITIQNMISESVLQKNKTFDMMVDRITANRNELTFHLLGSIELKEII